MKILCFSDLHAHNYREFDEKTDFTGSKRLDNILETLEYIKVYCVKKDINTILFAGDLFHVRAKVDTVVFNSIYDKMKEISDEGIAIIAIPGNHDDKDNSDLPQHSLHAFNDIKNMKVVDKLDTISLDTEHSVTCVRYSKNTQMIKDFINNINPEQLGKKPILLGHLGIDGGYVGKGSYPMAEAFSVEDLRPDLFNFIILGHFHRAQILGGYQHVYYTGAPIQHSFSDEGENKGFYIIDTDKGNKEFVPIDNPKFITVTSEYSKEELQEHANKGNYIRAYLREDEVQDFINIVPQNLKYKIHIEKVYQKDTRVDVKVGMDFKEIVTKYAEEYNPEALDVGLEILESVGEK